LSLRPIINADFIIDSILIRRLRHVLRFSVLFFCHNFRKIPNFLNIPANHLLKVPILNKITIWFEIGFLHFGCWEQFICLGFKIAWIEHKITGKNFDSIVCEYVSSESDYIGFSTTFHFWFLRHLKLRR
jgi:hypothetical protein